MKFLKLRYLIFVVGENEAIDMEIDPSDDKDDKARIADLERQLEELKKKNLKQSVQMEAVEKILLPDQIERLTLPETSNVPWSEEMLDKSIQAYASMHSTCYEYCRKNILCPRLMPTKRTLQRKLAKVPCGAGLFAVSCK